MTSSLPPYVPESYEPHKAAPASHPKISSPQTQLIPQATAIILFTMRGLCRLSARSATCKPRSIAATPRWQAARSIYTASGETLPYGFCREREQQHQQQRPNHQYATSQLQINEHSGFLPVPFVTEQLAGAHHTTDLFSRLLKERIVAVYGPVEDRMVSLRCHPQALHKSAYQEHYN